MKRARAAAAVAAGFVASTIVAATAAADDDPSPTPAVSVDPASGPAGRPFTFSGELCVSEAGPGVVELAVFFGDELINEEDPGFVTVDEEGNWSVGMVPIGFFPDEASAVGEYTVVADCLDAETGDLLVEYEPGTFEVVASTPTTPPTTPPTTEPGATPPTTAPPVTPPPPATPIVRGPDFTG